MREVLAISAICALAIVPAPSWACQEHKAGHPRIAETAQIVQKPLPSLGKTVTVATVVVAPEPAVSSSQSAAKAK